jgi:hypothetical protein
MKSANNYYYICEAGHLTVGDSNRKAKCDQKIREVKLVKKGKNKVDTEVIKETTCGAEIKETNEIPKHLELTKVWDHRMMNAFMTGQTPDSLRIDFLRTLQAAFSSIFKRLDELEKK